MNENYEGEDLDNIVILNDEDGNEVKFEFLDLIDLEDEEYVVLFRAHYFISNQFDFDEYDGFIINVSDLDDVNDLYLVSDVLITDYSSVFFDYAILERPMMFYMYDYDTYKNEMRDFYLDIHTLPGPVVKTQEELLKNLENLPAVVENYRKKYQEFNETYNPHQGACSEEYLKVWIRG